MVKIELWSHINLVQKVLDCNYERSALDFMLDDSGCSYVLCFAMDAERWTSRPLAMFTVSHESGWRSL